MLLSIAKVTVKCDEQNPDTTKILFITHPISRLLALHYIGVPLYDKGFKRALSRRFCCMFAKTAQISLTKKTLLNVKSLLEHREENMK